MGRTSSLLAACAACSITVSHADARLEPSKLWRTTKAWQALSIGGVRGITVGPIESALHPGKGYGTEACAKTMTEARRLGANWVSVTPFGRVWDLQPTGIDLTFEMAFSRNRQAVRQAVRQAHANGLRVLLVPHLWVETGGWRALVDPGSDAAWERWARAYRDFVVTWAKEAEEARVDMFAVGVELRNWVTSTHASRFIDVIHDVRRAYGGLVTYAANWDDVEQTIILGELDVIGINGFYPLADKNGAAPAELAEGGKRIARQLAELAKRWSKPILFTEIGYTTRADPAVRPWEWPDTMSGVVVDQQAQADAYAALIAPLLDEPWFAGFFAWRMYADPNDMSQEAEWGFSPRGKSAELVLRDAFAARWAADGEALDGGPLPRARAIGVGRY